MSVGLVQTQGGAVVGAPADVELSIHLAPGQDADAGKPGVAWLSAVDCNQTPAPQFNTIHVTTDASSGVASFVVCADGHEGKYDISANANGTYPPTAMSGKTTIQAEKQPAFINTFITSSSSSCDPAGADGGKAATVDELVTVFDCDQQPLGQLKMNVRDGQTGVWTSNTTNASGGISLKSVPCGDYPLSICKGKQ
jgi:hypothetical protein